MRWFAYFGPMPKRAIMFRSHGLCAWISIRVGGIAILIEWVYGLVMVDIVRSLRRNLDAAVAMMLVSMAIAIYLGPAWFFVAWFFGGCGYITYTALKR